MRFRRGFTLIELLVVISIIGLLASVVLSAVGAARIKGRDTARLATLNQLQQALELYASDHGHYPNTNGHWTGFDPTNVYYGNSIVNPSATNISSALAPYINTSSVIDPSGPAGTGNDTGYLYFGNGTDYLLMSWRRPENMDDFSPSVIVDWRCGTVVNGQCSNTGANAVGYWTSGAQSGQW